MEIWKPIINHPRYEVSNLGNVRRGDRLLKPARVSKSVPYLRVSLGGKKLLVHRCVMESFTTTSNLEVNHINGIKTDNRLDNLEWISHRDNVKHAYDSGLNDNVANSASTTWTKLHRDGRIPYRKGVQHHGAKLTDADIAAIRSSNESNNKLAQRFPVTAHTIRDIRRGKTWKHLL